MLISSDFHKHKTDLEKINYGIITLLAKGEDATTIQNYRPIYPLEVLFKIFTKALTMRSEALMKKIINTCQTTLIKGRYITDGVMLLQEILREARFRRQ
jgi:hypothetical protein